MDEVDLEGLEQGETVALEVGAEGGRVERLADPVALVAAFGLAPSEAARVARLAEGSADMRAAAVVRACAPGAAPGREQYDWLVTGGGEPGTERRLALSRALARDIRTICPGSITRLVVARPSTLPSAIVAAAESVRDVFPADLPAIQEHAFIRHGSIALDAVPIAVLLAAAEPLVEPSARLQELTGRPTYTATSEADAAALGALTTPGVSPESAVCDIGGGTIDVVWGGQRSPRRAQGSC